MATFKQKFVPTLWFESQAEEAAKFYVSIFDNSLITGVTRYGRGGAGPEGGAMSVLFELSGESFMALNGRGQSPFTEALSLLVHCESQDEVDTLWQKLTASGGVEGQCGWLKDRFGVSWQIVPEGFIELMKRANAEQGQRVTAAMLNMKKLDLASLERAFAGV